MGLGRMLTIFMLPMGGGKIVVKYFTIMYNGNEVY